MSTTEQQGPELAAAEERASAATKAYQEALSTVNNAWAEHARLTLLWLADGNPGLIGLRYETSYEYDDEGGYFASVNVYPVVEGDILETDIDEYDLSGYGHDVIATLCGEHADVMEGGITLAEARERRF